MRYPIDTKSDDFMLSLILGGALILLGQCLQPIISFPQDFAVLQMSAAVMLFCGAIHIFFKHRQPKLQGIEYLNYLIFIFLFSATYHGKSGNLFVIVMLGAALTSIRHFLFKRWGNAVAPLLLSFQKLTALLLTAFAIDQMLASFRLYFL